MTIAQKIRQFLRELFGSRLIVELELSAHALTEQYEARIQERDIVIADLRDQLAQVRAKIEMYELVLIPLSNSGGNVLNRRPAPVLEPLTEPVGWAAIQSKWERDQEAEALEEKQNGVRREQVPTETTRDEVAG